MNARLIRRAAVVPALTFVLTVCGHDLIHPATVSAFDPVAVPAPAGMSERATEVARLLDKGKVDGAKHLLNAYLPQHPGDVGLLAQKVRVDLSASEYLKPPLPDDESLLLPVISGYQTAIDLDEDFADYIGDHITRMVVENLENAAKAGRPLLIQDYRFMDQKTAMNWLFPGEAEQAVVLFGVLFGGGENADKVWLGMQFQQQLAYGNQFQSGNWVYFLTQVADRAPGVSKKWVPKVRELSQTYAKAGHLTSAIKLAFTAGYMDSRTWAAQNSEVLACLRTSLEQDMTRKPERLAAALDAIATVMNASANDDFSRMMVPTWLITTVDGLYRKHGRFVARTFLEAAGLPREQIEELLTASKERIE